LPASEESPALGAADEDDVAGSESDDGATDALALADELASLLNRDDDSGDAPNKDERAAAVARLAERARSLDRDDDWTELSGEDQQAARQVFDRLAELGSHASDPASEQEMQRAFDRLAEVPDPPIVDPP
jgi:hypothetical protein